MTFQLSQLNRQYNKTKQKIIGPDALQTIAQFKNLSLRLLDARKQESRLKLSARFHLSHNL